MGEEDYQELEAAIQTLSYLIELIGEKETTISRLRALLVKPSTEKTRKVLEQAGLASPPPSSSPPPSGSENDSEKKKPGHGRNGAEAYRGARRIKIKVPHGSLKPGDHCPKCQKGKVYARKEPGVRIRVVGQAPLAATVYELESLRCNLCRHLRGRGTGGRGREEVRRERGGDDRVAEVRERHSLYRLPGLEGNFGIPLPPATQWEIVAETAKLIRPAYEELIRQAAQGEVLYNDDTAMKILALARASPRTVEVDEEASDSPLRTGQFTIRDCIHAAGTADGAVLHRAKAWGRELGPSAGAPRRRASGAHPNVRRAVPQPAQATGNHCGQLPSAWPAPFCRGRSQLS